MEYIKKYKNLLPILLIGVALFLPKLQEIDWKEYLPNIGGGSEVVEVINFETVDEPTQEFKNMASGVGDLIVGDDSELDSMIISQFYSQLSKIIRNSENLQTTKQFREYYITSGSLNFGGMSMNDKYEGLGKKVDDVIVSAIGKESTKFTQESKQRLADVLAAISWDIYHPEQK